ncbi:hypothetical protein ACE6JH_35595 [Streptomyces nigra]
MREGLSDGLRPHVQSAAQLVQRVLQPDLSVLVEGTLFAKYLGFLRPCLFPLVEQLLASACRVVTAAAAAAASSARMSIASCGSIAWMREEAC